MTRGIPLSHGLVALVDDADYDLVVSIGRAWQPLRRPNGKFYAYVRTGRHGSPDRKTVYMHWLIAGTPEGRCTDHINGDGLDNRRANLRHATSAQNAANVDRSARGDDSPFIGVRAVNGRWRATIRGDSRANVSLGRFDTPEEAAQAYDRAAIAKYGAFARTNFPREDYAA